MRWPPLRPTQSPDPDPIVADVVFKVCGCRFEIRLSEMPVFALMCEHAESLSPSHHGGVVGAGSILIGADNRD